MQNYEASFLYFCPCLLKTVDLVVKNEKTKLSGEIFEFLAMNYSDETLLVETFPSKE